MLLVYLGIGFVFLTVGIIFYAMSSHGANNKFRRWLYNTSFYLWLNANGGFIVGITLLITIGVGVKCSTEKTIDEQIQIYQEENIKIESVVAEIVKGYQIYEQETFKSFTPEKIMVAFELYPELKSNALVVKQLDIHSENNKQIKELKSKKAVLTTSKWWLYFGK